MTTYIADFHMILWNNKTQQPPTPEDIKYIVAKFTKAVHDKGLFYGGTCEVKEGNYVQS